eukprot:491793-Amphidinium_carterae.1
MQTGHKGLDYVAALELIGIGFRSRHSKFVTKFFGVLKGTDAQAPTLPSKQLFFNYTRISNLKLR